MCDFHMILVWFVFLLKADKLMLRVIFHIICNENILNNISENKKISNQTNTFEWSECEINSVILILTFYTTQKKKCLLNEYLIFPSMILPFWKVQTMRKWPLSGFIESLGRIIVIITTIWHQMNYSYKCFKKTSFNHRVAFK